MSKDNDGRDVLALEICTTSLHDIIEFRSEEDSGPIPSKNCLKVIIDVATALDYLHNTALILHGDLKAPNVLVNGDFEICKLCDFGVALPLNKAGGVDLKTEPYANYIGTELWAAPEVFADEEITTKTDIFSFGCTIYEMITLTPPHLLMDDKDEASLDKRALSFNDDSENYDSFNCTTEEEADKFKDIVEERMGSRPVLPDEELGTDYDQIVEIFFACTGHEQDKRPSAKQIVDELTNGNKKK